jgi:hypothetical protein
MKRILAAAALAFSLGGCSAIPGSEAVTAAVAVASDVLTGPDTDYKNYLSHCRAEVKAQAEAIQADADALKAGLNSGNEKIQFGSLVLLAAKAGQGGPRIGCSAQRKKGTAELLLGESDLIDVGMRLYELNRAEKRFNRQLDANERSEARRLGHERDMEQGRGDLLRDLAGTYEDRKPAETPEPAESTEERRYTKPAGGPGFFK